MTAIPLSSSLAKVRKLLPVRIRDQRKGEYMVTLEDKNGAAFCLVPCRTEDAMARAELIRDAMNGMK